MWSNFPCVSLCRRSFRRRVDLGWPELIIGFLGSPVASFVEAVSRLLVFLGQHDGRYEAAFAQVKQHRHPQRPGVKCSAPAFSSFDSCKAGSA